MASDTASVVRYGPEAWLVDRVADPAELAARLRAAVEHGDGPDAVTEIVPAERTVLVRSTPASAERVGDLLRTLVASPTRDRGMPSPGGSDDDEIRVAVRWDGDDLGVVAERSGLTVEEVVESMTSTTFTSRFCGFSPGFAYLAGLDPRLHLDRRETPRTRVPAGSVAIAATYAAVYPSPSPGGWHLLGATEATVWDTHRDAPALLAPGTTVRFVSA